MTFQRYTRPLLWAIALGVAGCNPLAAETPEQGQALFYVLPARRVQYSASQVKAAYLTLKASGGRSYTYTYSPLALNGSFQFSVLNLPIGKYSATLAAYNAPATSSATLIGSTATDSFSITQGSTRTVVFPAISLSATPTASWPVQVTINVTSQGYTLSSATASIQEAGGRTASGPTWSTASKTFLWQNLLTFPVGTSTTSITATATKQARTSTKTVEATVSLVPGTNATASVTITL